MNTLKSMALELNTLENLVLELKVFESEGKNQEYEEKLKEIIIYLKERF